MRKAHIQQARNIVERRRLDEQGHDNARTRAEAARIAPWAAEFVRVDDGWLAFESAEDARIWRQQA